MTVHRNYKTGALIEPDRKILPTSHRLWWWRNHCEVEHGATERDYRSRVLEWHRENHPDCEAHYA